MAGNNRRNQNTSSPFDLSNVEDSIVIREKLIRIENHLKDYKDDREDIKLVRIALVGNELNGNEGLLSKIDGLSKNIKALESFKDDISEQTLLMKKELAIGKWVLGIIFTVFIGAIVKDTLEERKIPKSHQEQSYTK